MVRCTECGTHNDDDAKFCDNCGASLTGAKAEPGTEWRKKADEECAKTRGGQVFWGLIIVFIGAWLIFEFGIKNIPGLPQWVYDLTPWWIIPIILGIVIVIAGLRLAAGRGRDTCD